MAQSDARCAHAALGLRDAVSIFFSLPRRHVVGVGVAAAGEITERIARRSYGRLRRWDKGTIATANSRPRRLSARSLRADWSLACLPIGVRAGEHGNRDNRHREGDSHGAHRVHYPISAARHPEPSLLNSIRPIAPGKHRVCLAR